MPNRPSLCVCISIALSALALGCAGESTQKVTPEEKAMMLIQAASGAIQEGDAISALQYLNQAERTGGEDLAELHHVRAIAYYMKKDTKTALESEKKAIELNPDFSAANNTYGKLLLDAGRVHEAEKYLKLAAKDPLYREAFKANTNLGILYYRNGNHSESMARLNKAIEESPSTACVAYYYRGHLNLQIGNFKKAAKDYDKATQRICGGFADAHLALGIAYARDKQYDKARKKFLDVKSIFPDTKVAEQAMEQLRYLP
jgi:Tfp pilus assembly protein PilF